MIGVPITSCTETGGMGTFGFANPYSLVPAQSTLDLGTWALGGIDSPGRYTVTEDGTAASARLF